MHTVAAGISKSSQDMFTLFAAQFLVFPKKEVYIFRNANLQSSKHLSLTRFAARSFPASKHGSTFSATGISHLPQSTAYTARSGDFRSS